jgi:phosphate transport system permease protein
LSTLKSSEILSTDIRTLNVTLTTYKDSLVKPKLARASSQKLFIAFSFFSVILALLFLTVLLADLLITAYPKLTLDFIGNAPSRNASKAGIWPALVGSFWLMIIVAAVAVPLGVGAAIYLEEYAPKNRFTKFIELNIANLAGVPSIIYGLLGLFFFVRVLGFGRSVLSGGLTLSILVLPVVIISSREALKTVPKTIRQGALALGATQWQSIFYQVLPMAMPGILTGCILAFSRAIGETAPLVTMGALTYVAFAPSGPLSAFTALPIQAFNWLSRPQAAFHENAAAAIVILLSVLLSLNAFAIVLRIRYQKRSKV